MAIDGVCKRGHLPTRYDAAMVNMTNLFFLEEHDTRSLNPSPPRDARN